MVAGMTPTTANEEFVSACINAGFHVELAGGGQHTPEILRQRVENIIQRIAPGEGITLNILFLNPRLWAFQYPAAQNMRLEGIPIDGVCVAAGVPSLDVADETIKNLKAAGLRHIAFKPGSVETIRRVISIARNNPDMPVILQWTGGRGGGHHSFEDFHAPMLETYAAIRRQSNIILVVGSGFGDAEGTLPYITGSWSVDHDYPPMPFDGMLFGSRVMVAKEALTSESAKHLIANAPGAKDEFWERTYKTQAGGIITVLSELGEPIHVVANKGTKLWRDFDDMFFSLPREKRLPALLKKKQYVIEKLNSDHQKPWFGKKADGRLCDLHEMTYNEVIERMLDLMWVKDQSRWIDAPSYCATFGDFLRRVEERFVKAETLSLIQSYETLGENPAAVVEGFLEVYPQAAEQILTQEDVFYFLTICSYPWRKPGKLSMQLSCVDNIWATLTDQFPQRPIVPFIPIIDEKFDFWFKKDSLWQSEDVDAVVDRDAERVTILHGPVAAKHTNRTDQTVKEILQGIYDAQIATIRKLYYGDNDVAIPVVEYLGARPVRAPNNKLAGVAVTELPEGSVMYELTRNAREVPDTGAFLQFIAGQDHTWLRALLTSEAIVQGKLLVPNPISKILKPRPAQTMFIKYDSRKQPQILTVHERDVDRITPDKHPAVVISVEGDTIKLAMFHKRGGDFVPLEFFYTYKPWQGGNPVHEVMEVRRMHLLP